MRFSDMMGSEQQRKPAEVDSAISDALAPYLEAPAKPETAVAVEAESDTPAPRAHTAATAVFPIVPLRDEEKVAAPVADVEHAPVASSAPAATVIPDFTPLSDDLLPRRKR